MSDPILSWSAHGDVRRSGDERWRVRRPRTLTPEYEEVDTGVRSNKTNKQKKKRVLAPDPDSVARRMRNYLSAGGHFPIEIERRDLSPEDRAEHEERIESENFKRALFPVLEGKGRVIKDPRGALIHEVR